MAEGWGRVEDTTPTRMDETAIFVLVFAYSLFHMFSFFFKETHSIVLRGGRL